jgi:hypothetical protein
MSGRPILSKYPRLHGLLRRDPQANTEFNAALNEVATDGGTGEIIKDLQEQLARSEGNLQDQLTKTGTAVRAQEKTVRFIRLLGEILEAQTNFRPYVEDMAEKRKYTIEFSPAQIRMALRLYWDGVGQAMESTIARTVVLDPAAERESEDDDE